MTTKQSRAKAAAADEGGPTTRPEKEKSLSPTKSDSQELLSPTESDTQESLLPAESDLRERLFPTESDSQELLSSNEPDSQQLIGADKSDTRERLFPTEVDTQDFSLKTMPSAAAHKDLHSKPEEEELLLPSHEEATALYHLASEIRALAPWGWMEETDVFGVQDPHTDELGFVSIMGNVGEYEAVAVYRGAKGLYLSLIHI